jgi:hypothetical protein
MSRYVVTRRDHEGKMVLVGERDQYSQAWSLAHAAHRATAGEVVLWDEDDSTPLARLDSRTAQVAAASSAG